MTYLNDGGNYEYQMGTLKGTNHHLWMGKIKDFLFVKKMHLPIFCSKKLENLKINKLMRQICGFIRQYMEDNEYNHIVDETNAKTL